MASRHHIPVVRPEQVGSDEQKNIPTFLSAKKVEFSAGKKMEEVLDMMSKNSQVRVVAAPGAGKSVKLPVALLEKGGNNLVVHCVPSRLLALSLHDYVSKKNPTVACHFIDEVISDYPKSGLVFTNSATFVCQSAFWRVLGEDPEVCLFMDECHESDGGTHVLRNLRTSAHGVSRYIEASATFGTGDDASPFAPARLPAPVREYKYAFPPVADWDLAAKGTPWSGTPTANLLFFVDSEVDAQSLKRKYEEIGVTVFRLTGRTDPDVWRAADRHVSDDKDSLTVFIVDYSFRSGFTYPTFNRFIDPGKVGVRTLEAGRTVMRDRNILQFELHQTKNRGGRVAGVDSDYWRSPATPLNHSVVVEGAEADLACVFYRMLGFKPDVDIRGSPFSSGKVPRHLFSALSRADLLRCYEVSSPWPGVNKPALEPPVVLPLSLDSPIQVDYPDSDSSLSSVSSPEIGPSRTESLVDDAPASVFTLQTDDVFLGNASSDDGFQAGKTGLSRSSAMIGRGRSKHRPSPSRGLEALDEFTSKLRLGDFEFEPGQYYAATDQHIGSSDVLYFSDGVQGVLNAAGSVSVGGFLRGLAPAQRREAFFVALVDYTDAAVRQNAVNALLTSMQSKVGDIVVADKDAFGDWANICRDVLLAAQSRVESAAVVLRCMPVGALRLLPASSMADQEQRFIATLVGMLQPCLVSKRAEEIGLAEVDLPDDLAVRCQQYPCYASRLRVKVVGGGFRARAARLLLAGQPVTVDAMSV